VKVRFDYVAIERGESGGIGTDFVVVDDTEARVVEAEPRGDLRPASEKVDVPHPRGVEGEGAEAVAEQIERVAKALRVEVARATGPTFEQNAIVGATAIHPSINDVDRERSRHAARC
jgi:hypothetical protein